MVLFSLSLDLSLSLCLVLYASLSYLCNHGYVTIDLLFPVRKKNSVFDVKTSSQNVYKINVYYKGACVYIRIIRRDCA